MIVNQKKHRASKTAHKRWVVNFSQNKYGIVFFLSHVFFSPADGWSTSQKLRQWTCSSDLTCVTHLSSHVFTSVQAVLLSLRETAGPFKHKKYVVIFLVAVSLKNCSGYCQNIRLCIWLSLTEIVSQRYSWANSRTLLKTLVIQVFTNDVFK